MRGVDPVLKLCNLVVEVGRGKCLVEGCLPGCLESRAAITSAGRARIGRAYAYNLVRLLVHAAIRAKPGFSMRQMQLLGVFGVATLRNGVKRRDLAVFYYSIVFETASPSISPPPTMLNPLRPLSRSVRHFSSPAPASCKSPLMHAPPAHSHSLPIQPVRDPPRLHDPPPPPACALTSEERMVAHHPP